MQKIISHLWFEKKAKESNGIDYFWDKLTAVPEAEQCGWIKDKYGVSWQITPANMGELWKESRKDYTRNAQDEENNHRRSWKERKE
jgi:predicted 3-demethylubiquinone-9 3-methyltransferase (glyoxalase superfamily)